MPLKPLELTQITYLKESGEATDRFIIPTSVPSDKIKAIDVTKYSEEERSRMQVLFTEYQEYYKRALTQIFKFEDWMTHTQDTTMEVDWRTFKADKVTEIE